MFKPYYLIKQIRLMITTRSSWVVRSTLKEGMMSFLCFFPSLCVPPLTTMSYLLNSAKGYTYVEW